GLRGHTPPSAARRRARGCSGGCGAEPPSVSVDPRLGLELGDRHRLVVEARRLAVLAHERQAVAQPSLVVALGVVLARVRASSLPASKGGCHRCLRTLQQVAELERLAEIGVIAATLVLDMEVPGAL